MWRCLPLITVIANYSEYQAYRERDWVARQPLSIRVLLVRRICHVHCPYVYNNLRTWPVHPCSLIVAASRKCCQWSFFTTTQPENCWNILWLLCYTFLFTVTKRIINCRHLFYKFNICALKIMDSYFSYLHIIWIQWYNKDSYNFRLIILKMLPLFHYLVNFLLNFCSL